MARAINPMKPRKEILDDDLELPSSEQTIWTIRGLSCEEYAETQDSLVEFRGPVGGTDDDARTRVQSGSQELRILEKGLLNAENFLDEDGNVVPFPETTRNNRAPKLDFITRIQLKHRRELAKKITAASEAPPELAKKSDSQSALPASGSETAAQETKRLEEGATTAS